MGGEICIIGAGAIGGLVGSRLTKKYGTGKVVLVDTDKRHVRAIEKNGLRVYDKSAKKPRLETIPVNITTDDKIDKSEFEKVILATKSYSNDRALEGLPSEANILVLQNGFDERTAAFANSVRGVEFGFGCKVTEPGFILNTTKGKYFLGNLSGSCDKADEWAGTLNDAEVNCRVKSNIDGYLWSKVLINSALNPVTALYGLTFKQLVQSKTARYLFKALYIEGYPVVKKKCGKLGSVIAPPGLTSWLLGRKVLSDVVLKAIGAKYGEIESSMLQDIRNNRQTEIDFINGQIIKLAENYNIKTPLNIRMYRQLKDMESKSRRPAGVTNRR